MEMILPVVGSSPAVATAKQPTVWSLVGLTSLWILEGFMPMLSLLIAEVFAKGEVDPNYDSVDPHVLNYFLMTVVYGLVFFFPIFWATLTMLTKGRVCSKVLVWFIHHWSSNMTLINMIIASSIFGALYLGSKKEMWYIGAYLLFAVIGWVITMSISIEAIQFCEPGW